MKPKNTSALVGRVPPRGAPGILIKVKSDGATNLARAVGYGVSASSTNSQYLAAQRLAEKLFGNFHFSLSLIAETGMVQYYRALRAAPISHGERGVATGWTIRQTEAARGLLRLQGHPRDFESYRVEVWLGKVGAWQTVNSFRGFHDALEEFTVIVKEFGGVPTEVPSAPPSPTSTPKQIP